MRLSSDTKSRKSGSYLLSTEQHQTMFWWHHRPLLYLSFDLGKCLWLQRKIVQYFLNWVVLLFNRANCVSLTLSHWWCFKNLYFFIMFRYNCGIWTDIKKKKTFECVLPIWILGFADFVFSWKKTRPLKAGCLFMRRWNKLPKCFFMWNNQIARLLSRLFLAFG